MFPCTSRPLCCITRIPVKQLQTFQSAAQTNISQCHAVFGFSNQNPQKKSFHSCSSFTLCTAASRLESFCSARIKANQKISSASPRHQHVRLCGVTTARMHVRSGGQKTMHFSRCGEALDGMKQHGGFLKHPLTSTKMAASSPPRVPPYFYSMK